MHLPVAMKRLLSIAATVWCVACLFSCDGRGPEPPPEPEKPFPIGVWHTTHHFFKLEVDGEGIEEIRTELEETTSRQIVDAESYKLSFNEDGTGSGSGLDDEEERFYFSFTWELSDGGISVTEDESGSGVFFTHRGVALEGVGWNIDSHSADRMVLSWVEWCQVDNGGTVGWEETCTYRYTFEKEKTP